MPLYEYRCPDCGHEVEVLQPFDAAPPACPMCFIRLPPAYDGPVRTPMVKKVSRSSFELVGGGWAKDGYGK